MATGALCEEQKQRQGIDDDGDDDDDDDDDYFSCRTDLTTIQVSNRTRRATLSPEAISRKREGSHREEEERKETPREANDRQVEWIVERLGNAAVSTLSLLYAFYQQGDTAVGAVLEELLQSQLAQAQIDADDLNRILGSNRLLSAVLRFINRPSTIALNNNDGDFSSMSSSRVTNSSSISPLDVSGIHQDREFASVQGQGTGRDIQGRATETIADGSGESIGTQNAVTRGLLLLPRNTLDMAPLPASCEDYPISIPVDLENQRLIPPRNDDVLVAMHDPLDPAHLEIQPPLDPPHVDDDIVVAIDDALVVPDEHVEIQPPLDDDIVAANHDPLVFPDEHVEIRQGLVQRHVVDGLEIQQRVDPPHVGDDVVVAMHDPLDPAQRRLDPLRLDDDVHAAIDDPPSRLDANLHPNQNTTAVTGGEGRRHICTWMRTKFKAALEWIYPGMFGNG